MASSLGRSVSYEVERNLRTIFKRCVQCPNETPTCPDCPNNEICSLVPQDCNSCAHMTCIPDPSPPPTSSRPNVGAIAGGVVGGVAFMAIIVFFMWRFWIKKRREQQEMDAEWEADEIAQQKGSRRFSAMRADNASTRSRGSIANTILSRASNIIQIAYIPGVTNRNRSGHNSVLTNTPVPPIPAQYRNQTPKSPLSNEGDVLFFRPGSLRGSTYSDGSSIRSGNNRDTQYTRQSITPSLARSSMMSGMTGDVYMDDASAEPMPSAQVLRALPRMVSVKGSPASSPSDTLRGQPSPNPNAVKVSVIGQNSGGSTPRSNAYSGKATQVMVGKGRYPLARQTSDSSLSTVQHVPATSSPLVETAVDSDEEDEHARARRSLIQATARAADPAPLVQPLESPFFDASELQTSASSSAAARPNPYAAMSANVNNGRTRRANSRGPGGLSAVMEEAKRGSQASEVSTLEPKKDAGPFSDAHATN